MSDFRRLQLTIFSGMEKPLDAEQWLVDTTYLLKAAHVPDENQVEVVKIKWKDVARIWWLVEEAKLEKPITWDQFSKSFYERFSPDGIKRDERTIYQIALGGLNCRLVCCTVPKAQSVCAYMVADEGNRVSRFQQGLKMKIKMFLIPQQLKIYSQVFTIAREVEQELEKKNLDKMQMKSAKRPSQLMEGEDSDRPLNTPLAKKLL